MKKLSVVQNKILDRLKNAPRYKTVSDSGNCCSGIFFVEILDGVIISKQYEGTAITSTLKALEKKGLITIIPIEYKSDYICPISHKITDFLTAYENACKIKMHISKVECTNQRYENDTFETCTKYLIKIINFKE